MSTVLKGDVIMNKEKVITGLSVGVAILALAYGGYYFSKELSSTPAKFEKNKGPLPTPSIESVIHNEDGSIDFKLDFPEEYNYPSKTRKNKEPLPTPSIESVTHNEDGSIDFKLDFPEEYDYPSKTQRNKGPIPAPSIESVTHNEDGSIDFKLSFPEEYDYPKTKVR